MKMKILFTGIGSWLLAFATALPSAEVPSQNPAGPGKDNIISRYNVVWESASKDASGVMPIGNGDISAGVYAIENGDLFLLLAKHDAFTYMGDLFKTGRLRISLNPNPFQSGKSFRQTLDLATGSIRIEADGMEIRIWVDANRPVCHVEVHSPREVSVEARPEFWKRFDHCDFNAVKTYSRGVIGSAPPPQDVRLERNGKLLWYFAVGDRSVYPDDLKAYEVPEMASRFPDPFRYNTFGNLLEATGLALKDGELRGTGKEFDIRVHGLTIQTPEPSVWIQAIEGNAARPLDLAHSWKAHCAWWSDFWQRGWIRVSDNRLPAEKREKFDGEPGPDGNRHEADGAALVAQSYNTFRFLMACQSRGRIPTKFNGGLFTQQLRLVKGGENRPGAVKQADGTWLTHEDDRLWGRRFTYQNQRLLYWPLLASGDFDLMKPFFNYYSNVLPMRKAITKAWFGHDGAYYRENIEPTGAERDCDRGVRPPKTKPGEKYDGWYHDYYFTCGLETTAMMIDYADYTGEADFRDRVLTPFAREIMLFFDQHYPRGADGKLHLEAAQCLETWWVSINPSPDIAGLRFCLDELLRMKAGNLEDQKQWKRFRAEIPEIPVRTLGGHPVIVPAESWDRRENSENGELYAVFPFRCFGVALGSSDIVNWTMGNRIFKDVFRGSCWTQDQIDWACAGNAAEAADGLDRRFRVASPMCRFPMFGRQDPDSCPDLDHFGSGSLALQRMLVQETRDKILLLPAWPADWDADFKLRVTGGGIISGTIKDGKLVKWDIVPSARKSQVTVCQIQPPKTSRAASQ